MAYFSRHLHMRLLRRLSYSVQLKISHYLTLTQVPSPRMMVLLTAASQSLEQVAHPGLIIWIHDSIQQWIHRWPNDPNSRWTAVKVEIKLCVGTKDSGKLNEEERSPESSVHDCYPEAQLGCMSLVRRSIHSFKMGSQGEKYLQVDHGCKGNRQAVQGRRVPEEHLRICIQTLVNQQAAVKLWCRVAIRELISGHEDHKNSGRDAQDPEYGHHQACLHQREPGTLWSQHDIFSMVSQQWENKIHQGNAEHGEKQADFANRCVCYKLSLGVHPIDEQHRGKKEGNQQIGDRQVGDEEVKCFSNGVVGHIRIDYQAIAEGSRNHGEDIQRANECCGNTILLIVIHHWHLVSCGFKQSCKNRRDLRGPEELSEVISTTGGSENRRQNETMWFIVHLSCQRKHWKVESKYTF